MNDKMQAVLDAWEKEEAVDSMALINALAWRLRNQKRELLRGNMQRERLAADLRFQTAKADRLVTLNGELETRKDQLRAALEKIAGDARYLTYDTGDCTFEALTAIRSDAKAALETCTPSAAD
jgi:hypothetical protein